VTSRQAPDACLTELANRLAALSPRNAEDVGFMSVTVGAIYALRSALWSGYVGRPSHQTLRGHVDKAAAALARSVRPATKTYLAGYYFNDALLRLDIAYENLIRRITRCRSDERIDDLIEAAGKKGIDPARFHEWRKIRREVGGLKHRNPEQIALHKKGAAVTIEVMVSALSALTDLAFKVIPREK